MDSSKTISSKIMVVGDHELAETVARELGNFQPVVWLRPHGRDDTTAQNVKIFNQGVISKITGSNGNFTVEIEQDGKRFQTDTGAVIVIAAKPSPLLMRFRKALNAADASSIAVFVNDVYAGEFLALLKEAITGVHNGHRIIIFVDQLQVSAYEGEEICRQARELGIIFFKQAEPAVAQVDSGYEIKVRLPELNNYWYTVKADVIVSDDENDDGGIYSNLIEVLGIKNNIQDHFPLGTLRRGIFNLDIEWAENLGLDHARSLIKLITAPYQEGSLTGKGQYTVNPDLCALCLTCYRVCPHRAIEFGQPARNWYGQAMMINPTACENCGICRAECPAEAIHRNSVEAEEKSKTAVLACSNAAGPWLAGRPDVYLAACAGEISMGKILEVMTQGVERVRIMACYDGNCKHDLGNKRLGQRAAHINTLLDDLGLKHRVEVINTSALKSPV